MTVRDTDSAINMVIGKRENDGAETFATRSVALPFISPNINVSPKTLRILQNQKQKNISLQKASNTKLSSSSLSHIQNSQTSNLSYRLIPVSDSVLKLESENKSSEQLSSDAPDIPSSVIDYSNDFNNQEEKDNQQYPDYGIHDEIDEGYKTNSSVASPSSSSVASYECSSPTQDSHIHHLKNDEKVRKNKLIGPKFSRIILASLY